MKRHLNLFDNPPRLTLESFNELLSSLQEEYEDDDNIATCDFADSVEPSGQFTSAPALVDFMRKLAEKGLVEDLQARCWADQFAPFTVCICSPSATCRLW